MELASSNRAALITTSIGVGVAAVGVATICLAFHASTTLGLTTVAAAILVTINSLRGRRTAGLVLGELPIEISVSEIGKVEGGLANLKRVIVIADTVQFPRGELLKAVEHNLTRGVKYLFLVSARHAQGEQVAGYYNLFRTSAEIVISRRGFGERVEDLIDIQQFPDNWDDCPYIFYEIDDLAKGRKILSFRGDQVRQGITGHYVMVEPESAYTIAHNVFERAPEKISAVGIKQGNFLIDKEANLAIPERDLIM